MKHLSNCILVLSTVCVLFAGCKTTPVEQTTFRNPVIRGDLADPTIIRIGETYYAAATSSEWAPFYPIFTSTDLVNWDQAGHIFDEKPEWTRNSFWAPELFHHNNKVYCYYTARRDSDGISFIGVASADSPLGEYTDHGVIIEHGREAIDAFVYDDDGQLYITWKAYGLEPRPIEIIGSKLSADGLRLEGEPFTMLIDDENIGMEGQYHFKNGDYYYIIYASRGCCGPGSDYDVCVARSKSFTGPYEKFEGNPIMHGGEESEFISSGHGTAVTTPDGRMYYMCHGYLRGNEFFLGRQPILQEMAINEEGWVYFPSGEFTRQIQPMPFKVTIQKPISNIETPYEWWTWNYPFSDVTIENKGKEVILTGTPKADNLYGSVACIRPVQSQYYYETKVSEFNSSFHGLTMYGDDKNLIIWGAQNDKIILKSVRDGEETVLWEIVRKNSKPVYFRINVMEGRMLNFSLSDDAYRWSKINSDRIDGTYLVRWDRVARPGLIHIGNPDEPAKFDYFKLINN